MSPISRTKQILCEEILKEVKQGRLYCGNCNFHYILHRTQLRPRVLLWDGSTSGYILHQIWTTRPFQPPVKSMRRHNSTVRTKRRKLHRAKSHREASTAGNSGNKKKQQRRWWLEEKPKKRRLPMLGGLLEYLRAAGRGRWAAEEEEDEGESKNPGLVGLMKNALDMSSGVRRGERARHLPPKEISLAGASPSVLGGAGHFLPWGNRAGFAVVVDNAPSLTGLSAGGAGLDWESLCFSVSLRALSDEVVCVPSTDFVALDAGTASCFTLKALSRWSREVTLSSNDWLDTSADKSISFKQARKESRSRHV